MHQRWNDNFCYFVPLFATGRGLRRDAALRRGGREREEEGLFQQYRAAPVGLNGLHGHHGISLGVGGRGGRGSQ